MFAPMLYFRVISVCPISLPFISLRSLIRKRGLLRTLIICLNSEQAFL
jgi:hypothetical protein